MGHTVMVIYRPVPGREADLLQLVRAHVPRLRELGLAAHTEVTLLRSASNGNILEIFDWLSAEAVDEAHAHPEVIAMWDAFDVVSDFLPLQQLAEAGELFPHFERVALTE